MITFGYGEHMVKASSIEEGLAIIRFRERLKEKQHKCIFNDNLKCVECGISQKECHMSRRIHE